MWNGSKADRLQVKKVSRAKFTLRVDNELISPFPQLRLVPVTNIRSFFKLTIFLAIENFGTKCSLVFWKLKNSRIECPATREWFPVLKNALENSNSLNVYKIMIYPKTWITEIIWSQESYVENETHIESGHVVICNVDVFGSYVGLDSILYFAVWNPTPRLN